MPYMARQRGRPKGSGGYGQGYTTSWGELIVGLRRVGNDPFSNERFFPIGRHDVSFGRDEKLAIHRFRMWQAEQSSPDSAKHSSEVNAMTPLERAEWISRGNIRNRENPVDPFPSFNELASRLAEERERLRTLILLNPKQAAIELNIPHLAFHPVTPEKPAYDLDELGQHYLDNARNKQRQPLDAKHKKNSKAWWTEFLDCVQVRYARDLTQEHIKTYHDKIYARFDEKDPKKRVSPAYIRSRFAKVKTILNHGLTFTDDKDACQKALNLCAIFKSPPEKCKPTPISVDNFQKLLDAAWTRERALLLLGLNLMVKSDEAASLLKSSLDLTAQTYQADRKKTGIPRVAKLWDRTVQAIRDYQKECPKNHSDYLFTSRTGHKLSGESVRQLFQTLRTRAGVDKAVKFEQLRDGAYKQAYRINPIYARWIGGHATWAGGGSESKDITTRYVEREPNDPTVILLCKAVEDFYFPPKETTTKTKSTKGKK